MFKPGDRVRCIEADHFGDDTVNAGDVLVVRWAFDDTFDALVNGNAFAAWTSHFVLADPTPPPVDDAVTRRARAIVRHNAAVKAVPAAREELKAAEQECQESFDALARMQLQALDDAIDRITAETATRTPAEMLTRTPAETAPSTPAETSAR